MLGSGLGRKDEGHGLCRRWKNQTSQRQTKGKKDRDGGGANPTEPAQAFLNLSPFNPKQQPSKQTKNGKYQRLFFFNCTIHPYFVNHKSTFQNNL